MLGTSNQEHPRSQLLRERQENAKRMREIRSINRLKRRQEREKYLKKMAMKREETNRKTQEILDMRENIENIRYHNLNVPLESKNGSFASLEERILEQQSSSGFPSSTTQPDYLKSEQSCSDQRQELSSRNESNGAQTPNKAEKIRFRLPLQTIKESNDWAPVEFCLEDANISEATTFRQSEINTFTPETPSKKETKKSSKPRLSEFIDNKQSKVTFQDERCCVLS